MMSSDEPVGDPGMPADVSAEEFKDRIEDEKAQRDHGSAEGKPDPATGENSATDSPKPVEEGYGTEGVDTADAAVERGHLPGDDR
ncbi:hypothetical protein BH23ACT7_BH23ACT7_18960 [soil metagenome]